MIVAACGGGDEPAEPDESADIDALEIDEDAGVTQPEPTVDIADSEQTTAPDTTAPDTTAPDTTAPDTTAPATTVESTTSTPAGPGPETAPDTALPPTPTGEEVRAAIESSLLVDGDTVDLADRLAALEVSGATIAVVADGEIVTSFAVGTTPDGAPMTTDTIMQVGSVSKPVAALAAASLAADGTISWDDDVRTLLTSYDLVVADGVSGDQVTIHQLLSHTGGANVDGFLGYGDAASAPELPAVLAGAGDTPAVEVVAEPGSFLYSGGGYELVEQAMLDVVGATSFDELVRSRVFGPAGMADSFYALEPSGDQLERLSVGSIGLEPLAQGWQRHPENAAAGLWTTAPDLANLLVAFNDALAGDDQTLLPTKWAQRMVEPVVDAASGLAVGTGWFLDSETEPRVYRHNGRNIGYTAEVAGTTDGRFGVVVMTNSFPGGTDLAREVIATVADAQGWDAS